MILYFDMDRVLVDFEKQASKYKVLKKNNRIKWLKVFFLGEKFWSSMEWFPNAESSFQKLMNFCTQNEIEIKVLSSVRLLSGRRGKQKWCRRHLNIGKNKIILVKKASMKCRYANRDAVLIDDNIENVDSFIKAGGKAIKFSVWTKDFVEQVQKEIFII